MTGARVALIGLAIASALFGGIALGWFGRGAHEGPATTGATSVQQPTGKLDPENAKKLVTAWMTANAGNDQCRWDGVRRTSEKAWTFSDYDLDAKCGAALEKAGYIVRGDCIDPGCGGCCKRDAKARGQAAFSATGDMGVWFPCGEMRFIGITSVTTEGNAATIVYSREFIVDNAALVKVTDCKLEKPEAGQRSRQRHAKRDDAGNWTIID